MRELGADILVLTEPPASYRAGPGVVTSPSQRSGPRGPESWVAIVGTSIEPVEIAIPYERLAVAARTDLNGRHLVIYGAVLPWLAVTNHAPYLVQEGETSLDVFRRVLAAQAADVAELRRRSGEPVLWLGDFNQTLIGSLAGGSAARRSLLLDTLAGLGLEAWNGSADHMVPGLCAVDLICGPKGEVLHGRGRIDPVRDGVTMSDHAGYWVDL